MSFYRAKNNNKNKLKTTNFPTKVPTKKGKYGNKVYVNSAKKIKREPAGTLFFIA